MAPLGARGRYRRHIRIECRIKNRPPRNLTCVNSKKKRRLVFAAVIASALGFFALPTQHAWAQAAPDWKPGWEKVLSEAKKEGKVVVKGPPGELIRRVMTEDFAKAFPDVAVEFTGGRSAEAVSSLRSERAAGLYTVDIFIGGTTSANVSIKPLGALDPITPALILPEITDGKNWRAGRLEFSDPDTRLNLVFSLSVQPVLAYNLELVQPREIDERQKLLDSKWKGKIVLNDPLPAGAGNETTRFIFHSLGLEQATDYFRKIRAHAGAVGRDQRQQLEWVARGKYAILFGPDLLTAQQLRQLKFGMLPHFRDIGSGTTAGFGSLMLINRAPHPNAAAVYINWLLGREGQAAFSKASGYPSLRMDVPTDHLPEYSLPKPGVKYWPAYLDKYVMRTAEEEKILKELFGR